MGLVGLAMWAVLSGFCSAGSFAVPCADTRLLFRVSEVQCGSACGPSTLWRSEVVVPVVRRCFSRGFLVSLVVTPGCSFPRSWRFGMLVPMS
ncbi:hypothetical protein Taro_040744 [Colocasia esculenta]|uniref:Secreted protein n=1 Tax=Colocasia esculenta TaxID=4460 RepID=A0A843WDZ3_COLES|nr:hypothetical protein [Colocasia esculenta]